jgi:hypothetical protein
VARIRTIKPEFWIDQQLSLLPRDVRLFYIALWNFADDEARLRGELAYLKGQIFPYDIDIKERDINAFILMLEELGKLWRWTASSGEVMLYLTNFNTHQKIDKRADSKLPPPPHGLATKYIKKAIPNHERLALAVRYGAAWGKKPSEFTCKCGTRGKITFYSKSHVFFSEVASNGIPIRALEIDHIIPESSGGETTAVNLQLLCQRCNRAKSSAVPAEKSVESADIPPMDQGSGIRDQGSGNGRDRGGARESGREVHFEEGMRPGKIRGGSTPALLVEAWNRNPKAKLISHESGDRLVDFAIGRGADPKAIDVAFHDPKKCEYKFIWELLDELTPKLGKKEPLKDAFDAWVRGVTT